MADSASPGTSSEGGSSPSCVAPVRAAPKKKRVRRQQLELSHLRELSGQLEHRLEQLKKRRCGRPGAQTSGGNCSPNTNAKAKYGPVSVWEAIADRQYKERSRVEKQNEELKLLLKTQSSMAQTLQARAQKAIGDKELQGLTMLQLRNGGPRYWDLASGDDEGIFADLLTLVVKTRLEMQRRRVENPRSLLSFATWGISIGEPHVRPDSEAGVVMETHACSLVPFNVRTTAAAYWRMFSLSFTKDRLNVNDTEPSDVFARSFTCSSTHFGRQIDMRGKHTCRKFVDEDGSITMVFAGRTGPADTNAPCHEVQIQKSGWVKVRQLEGQDSDNQSSAMVEIHSEMLPRFRNGIVGQEHRAREVINYVVKSHHVMNDLCRQMLSELLVEEDWKAFRGDGTEVAA